MTTLTVHATAVNIGHCGILIRGAPGSGKSSLALQLIDAPGFGLARDLKRAGLVADDQVVLSLQDRKVYMAPPVALAGLLEVRGLGIVKTTHVKRQPLALVLDLVTADNFQRMPEDIDLYTEILGIQIRKMAVLVGDPSGPAKVRAALDHHVACDLPEA